MDNPYDRGYQAFTDGQELEANPFPEGTEEHDDWEAGWVGASADQEDNDE